MEKCQECGQFGTHALNCSQLQSMNEQNPQGPESSGKPSKSSQRKRPAVAIVSLVCGILALVAPGGAILASVPAIVCGFIALKQIKNDDKLLGRGMAMIGIMAGIISILLLPIVTLPARRKAREAQCLRNMKQIGIACQMYSDEHNYKLPTRLDDLKPYLLSDKVNVFVCPSARDQQHYSYELTGAAKEWQSGDITIIAVREIEANHEGKRTVLYNSGDVASK